MIVLGRAAQVRWEDVPDWAYVGLIPLFTLASYYFVETPGRRRVRILPPVLAGACAVGVLAGSLICFQPSPDLSRFAPTVWMGDAYNVSANATIPESLREGITQPERDPDTRTDILQGGIIKRYGGERVDVLVLGNSHALMWAPVIDEICRELHWTVSFYAAIGVPPFPEIPARRQAYAGSSVFSPEEWFLFDSNRINLIKQWKPRLVIVASKWNSFLPERGRASVFLEQSRGTSVLLIGDPPELARGDIKAPTFLSMTSSTTVKAGSLQDLRDSSAWLRSLSDRFEVQLAKECVGG